MLLSALRFALAFTALLVAAEARAADAADPAAPVPALEYRSVLAGTRSYRPVEPLPWGEVNRRVAPPGALPPQPATPPAGAADGRDQGGRPHPRGQH